MHLRAELRGFFVIGCTLAALACAPARLAAKQYSFKLYSQQEGLSNQVIDCIAQDHKGFLWVGTQNGLFRYDGFQFTRFGVADGLPDDSIQALHEAPDGTFWAGTRKGVASFSGERFYPDPVLGKAELFGYSNIVSGPHDRMYIGTAHGLAVRQSSPRSGVSRVFFLTEDSVSGVYLDPSGTVWFGAGGLLWQLHADILIPFGADSRLPLDRWDSVVTDKSGTVWVRSSERLMFRRKGHIAFESASGISLSPEFGSLYQTGDGRLLVPTALGLMYSSGNHWERIGKRQGLASDDVSCIFQDREGSVWLGLNGFGLQRWLGYEQWQSWKTTDGLSSDLIWDIQRDASGVLLVGTGNGVHAQDPETGNWKLQTASGFSVRTVLDDPEQNAIWLGANPGGLLRYDRKTRRTQQFGPSSGLSNDRVNKLFWDSEHHLWVTTRGGLFEGRVDHGALRFEMQPVPFSDPNEGFYGYLFDHLGRLWVGGLRGLLLLENGRWQRFQKSDGLSGDGVIALAETPDGAIWTAYMSNSGVSRLRFVNGKPHFDLFTTRNGLTSNGIVTLGIDRRGWLWAGSDNGIDVYNNSSWKHYSKADGLALDDCDTLAFLSENDGSVWIGTSGGLSQFHPPPFALPQIPPQPYITTVETGKGTAAPTGPIVIPYRDRSRLLIKFSVPTFLNENGVRVRYRMLGLAQDWLDTRYREVRYPNLSAGNYTFEVIARSAQGKWSPMPARVQVRVLPAWWQTWQFRLLLVALLAALVHALSVIRVRYMVKKQQQLESLLSQARTADLAKTEAIEKITKAEARERNRSLVLESVGSHESLDTVLSSLVNLVESDNPNLCCLILVLRDGQFQHGASHRLPQTFARSFEGLALSSAFTCFAAAAQRLMPVEVGNLSTSPLWVSRRDSMMDLGLTTSLSGPIVSSSGEVLGTITFFNQSQSDTSAEDRSLLEGAIRLAGIAMQHLSLYEQLSYRAQYDLLTELPNRALFQDRLQQAMLRAERDQSKLAVVWVDLDGFKHVNDTLGHHAGDALLQTIARRITSCLRRGDTSARMGGDEFTILMDIEQRADLVAVIRKLVVAISEPVKLDGQEVSVTASLGVSIYPDHASDAISLIKHSDLAMYHVKRLGKNAHSFFSPEMASLEANRIEMESHLRNAVAGREFELHYQPQYTLEGTLVGFEALLRWNSPALGPVSPARFIPVAEATGLIVSIGEWVLEEACRQAADWIASGFDDFRMAVNVSACQFAKSGFPESVARVLESTGISPHRIELELTETAIMNDVSRSSTQLLELREAGVSLAIDDFGTGYSSLSYLQRLPVDVIKIDHTFVQALDSSASSSLTMIQAIVKLAHDLNLRVVAEGVETEEQLDCLKSADCDVAQGYLFSKPLTARDATHLLMRNSEALELIGEETLVGI